MSLHKMYEVKIFRIFQGTKLITSMVNLSVSRSMPTIFKISAYYVGHFTYRCRPGNESSDRFRGCSLSLH